MWGLQLSAPRIPNDALVRQAEDLLEHLPSGGVLHVHRPASVTGPPILFLHGLGGGAWSWEPQVRALASRRACYVWEARGHGSAERVADAGIGDYLVDAREALASTVESARRPAVVAAHSLGGLLALVLACEVAAAVDALFLVDPFVGADGALYPLPGALAALARVAAAPVVRSFRRDGPLSRRLVRAAFVRAFANPEAMERAWPAQRTQIPFEYPRIFYEGFGRPSHFPQRAFLDELAVPVYVLAAGSAEPARYRALDERLSARLGAAFTADHVSGGHYLQLDQPDAVSQRLLTFADAVTRRA